MNDNRIWYAAQRDCTDDWDNGSFDFNEAMAEAKKFLNDGYPDALVAAIENDVCIEEYRADEN